MTSLVVFRRSLLSAFLVLVTGTGWASQSLTTARIADAARQAGVYADKLGASKVLVAFDLDDTLLAPNQDLGSSAWYEWQMTMIKAGHGEGRIAVTAPGFFERLTWINAMSGMHPAEATTAQVVSDLRKKGIRAIVLTARAPEVRDSTELALRRNGMDFDTAAIDDGFPGPFLPVTAANPEGLSPEEIGRFGLTQPRPVSYMAGVFLANGQHKGSMLRVLLHKMGVEVRAIVFADDNRKNCDAVQAAFAGSNVDVTTFEYTAMKPQVERFGKSDKKDVIRAWTALEGVVRLVFPQ